MSEPGLGGWTGTLLRVDLTRGSIEKEAIDADRVRARSVLLYTWETLEIPREVSVRSTVIYEDEVRRTSGGWLFSARTCDTRLPLDDVYFS